MARTTPRADTCAKPSRTVNRVLIIGGYGGFGARLARRLAANAWTVLVAGRQVAKARDFCANVPNAIAVRVDRDEDIGAVLVDYHPDLVIDAAGPFQGSHYRVAEACIQRGVAYLDLADARDFVHGISRLDSKAREMRVPVITGASSVPALSGAVIRHLAKDMTDVRAVEIAISASNRATIGASVIAGILSYVGKPVRLWRGRRWTTAIGWRETRRQQFAVNGVKPLSRLTALADVPDHDSVPASIPGKPAVTFMAGPEFAFQLRALRLLSWVIEKGWVTSPPPGANLLHRLLGLTAGLGSDRSAMTVSVKGFVDEQALVRRWTLIAEIGDGPEIPVLAAELLSAKIRKKEIAPGAWHAGNLLDLKAFAPLFAALSIRCGLVAEPYEPVYRRIMGARFDSLPVAIQALHELIGDDGAAGRAVVTRGRSRVAKLICSLMRFPPAGTSELHVAFSEHNGIERWERDFGGRRFASEMRQSGNLLEERFGPLRFYFDLLASDAGLEMLLRKWSIFHIPLPLSIAPRSRAIEFVEDGKFSFDVAIAIPWFGALVHYKGHLTRAQ